MEYCDYIVVQGDSAVPFQTFTWAKMAAASCLSDGEISIYKSEADGDFLVWKSDDDPALRAYCEYTYEQWESLSKGHHEASCKPSVYFDIDGTCGRWYTDMCGYDYEDILKGNTHYFRDIDPHTDVINLARQLCEDGYDVCVMSAAGKDTIRDKWEWIEENMPFIPKENICFCPLGADKSEFVKGNADISLLIDDYQKNLDLWKGTSVKLLNGINHYHPDYEYIDITSNSFDLNAAVKLIEDKLNNPLSQNLSDPSHGEEYNRLFDERERRIAEIRNEANINIGKEDTSMENNENAKYALAEERILNPKSLEQELYEDYKTRWVSEHITDQMMTETEAVYENMPEAEDMTFEEFVEEYGFSDGSCYVSFEEFLNNDDFLYELASAITETMELNGDLDIKANNNVEYVTQLLEEEPQKLAAYFKSIVNELTEDNPFADYIIALERQTSKLAEKQTEKKQSKNSTIPTGRD